MASYDNVKLAVEGGIGTVTIDRPKVLNALNDATLHELASAKPANERDLAAVKGFGPTKLERYGDDVLAVIAAA